jgi:tRNA modification GTPase
MSLPDSPDTIAAISTPLGQGGIGIVRLSGPEAGAIAQRLFRPRRAYDQIPPHRLILGHILDHQGRVVDEVLLAFMPAPRSYTTENVVEINCHGGYAALRRVLELAISQGARLARPGEFTLRAFLGGRLDLAQAEAVLEVIQARTGAALRLAAGHLAGGLGRELGRVRETLLDLLARLDASLDFPEESEELDPAALAARLASPLHTLETLAATYQEGRLLREGLRVVIAGRPNVGKSSLLNRLLQADRAIVTDIPGTTRDVIEESITLAGVAVRLSDTAGLRESGDPAEALGVARTHQVMGQADLVLYLVDGSAPLDPEDVLNLQQLPAHRGLAVINKIDLPRVLQEAKLQEAAGLPVVQISALTGSGLADLQQTMVDQAMGGGLSHNGEIITQTRHHQHIRQALACLNAARHRLEPPAAWELAALEIRDALRELGEITGEEVGDAVLERIFAQFCIGK